MTGKVNKKYYICFPKKKKIMAIFGWFGDSEHRVFDYKPRYYDKEKDELKQKFGRVDGSYEQKDSTYVPGAALHGAFRNGIKKRGEATPAQKIITIVGLILFFGVLIMIAKFYSVL